MLSRDRIRGGWRRYGALSLSLAAAGCGVYSTSARLPTHLTTVHIETFENETSEFLLPQQINEGLVNRFQEEGDLRVTSSPSADAFLEGTILDYREEPLAYVGGGDVLQRKVRIFVRVRFIDQVRGEVLWETERMERWAVYDAETEEEEDGIRRAVDKLAEDVISQALKGW
jgi:TolB-like protein